MADFLEGMLGSVRKALAPTQEELNATYQAKLNRDKLAMQTATKLAQDRMQEPERRVEAAKQVEQYKERINANPLVIQTNMKTRKEGAATRKADSMLAQAGIAVAPPAAVAAAPKLSFAPAQAVTPAVATPGVPAPPHPALGNVDPADYFTGLGFKVTSLQRTPEHNAEVGGVPNSMHVTKEAADIQPPKGADRKATVKYLKTQGFTEVIDEGDHIHVGWRGAKSTPFAVANSMVPQGAGAVNTGGVITTDPQMLAGMLRAPQMLPGINLPNAPHQAAPAELSPYQGLDSAAIMAQYAEALKPVVPDASHYAQNRLGDMLTAAAQAAASGNPTLGLGNLIGRAGGAGAAAFTNRRDEQKAEQTQYQEQVRAAKLALEARGFQLKGKETDLANFNMDRITTNEQNKKNVAFSNMSADDQRTVQEILANHNVAAANIGEGNQFRRAQDTIAIQGTQSNAAAVNAATGNQVQANAMAAKAGGAAGVEAQIEQMLVSEGIDTKNARNPKIMTARSTAAAILAGRPDAAISSFAEELVQTPGAVQTILAPDKSDMPEVAKAKLTALKEYSRAKKPADAWGTIATLAGLMNGDHGAALQIAEMFKGQSPSAALILKNNKAAQAAPAAAQAGG